MKQKFTLLFFLLLSLSVARVQAELIAAFTADQTEKTIYKQGFDSPEGLSDWILASTNSVSTWSLGNSRSSELPDFSTIDPTSAYSLFIKYDASTAQNEEYASPVFAITAASKCKFYAAFDGVFSVYAPLMVIVEDQSDKSRETIFNSFLWSQDNGHDRPKWLSFEFALNSYAGKNVRIIFSYKGVNGDDVLIDDFCIVEKDDSDEAKVSINEGQTVTFKDLSSGNPTSWLWTFDGGTPATSTEQNPSVNYNSAGKYNVSLVVSDGSGNSSVTRTGFITVKGVAPVAAFDFPDEGYLSTDVAIFLPPNTPVTYIDKSKNLPTEWKWNLPGTENIVYTTQNATVTYPNSGTYGAVLTVANSQGNDILDYQNNAVQVGGSAHIWNIGINESEGLDALAVGWYGYYGGTNWLDMYAFAERYKKPAVKGSLSAVDIYFAHTETVDSPVDITVSIRNEKDGLPGDVLATSVLSTDQLAYDASNWVPTTFSFNSPVAIDAPFYVVVEGIPNRQDVSYNEDKVVIGAVRRDNKSEMLSTVYHYGPVYDNEEAGSVWLKNTDENISFAIAPLFTYDKVETGIASDQHDNDAPLVTVDNGKINISRIEAPYSVKVYNLAGVLLSDLQNQTDAVSIDALTEKGIYIVKVEKNNSVWSFKVNL